MSSTAPLSSRTVEQLVRRLRLGDSPVMAAESVAVPLAGLWAAARSDARLAVALAGRDPDTVAERVRIVRADYLRLLALGIPPARADWIVSQGGTTAAHARGADPRFAAACDAVAALAEEYQDPRPPARLTPEAVSRFLEELASGATVSAAALAAGVSKVALYKRRSRDPAFAAAWDTARGQGQ